MCGAAKTQLVDCQTKKNFSHEELLVPFFGRGPIPFEFLQSLEDFLVRHFYDYDPYFQVGRKTQKDKALQYIKGLFCAERGRRNMERMVEEVHGSEYESLQHFISDSPWDTDGLMQHLAHSVSRDLRHLGLIGCTVDEKAHIKKGKKSVGVARQYAGNLGKVENCQVSVHLSLCADRYANLVNHRLYIPREWTDDKERCRKAGVPNDCMVFKTKPELGLEMVGELVSNGVHFDYVNGDGLYGNGYTFSKGLDSLGVRYVLDVHSDQRIFLHRPVTGVPHTESGKRGRKPVRLKADVSGIKVSEYASSLRKSDYKEVRIRPTTKGWLTAHIHVVRVWVWDEKEGDTHAIEQTLVISNPMRKNDRVKYSLSNISLEQQNIETFAFMQAQRFWIEKCFKDDSHELGMSDYQVRSYKGFCNHMALTCVAMHFVLRQRLAGAKKYPLLSYNDVRILFAAELMEKHSNNLFDRRIKQMKERHKQRVKDVMRYYKVDLPK